jgi:hypothetical protein
MVFSLDRDEVLIDSAVCVCALSSRLQSVLFISSPAVPRKHAFVAWEVDTTTITVQSVHVVY